MFRTRQLLAEAVLNPIRSIFNQRQRASRAKFQHSLHAFGQALSITERGNNSIQNGLDGVQLIAAKRQRIFAASFQRLANINQLAINARANQTLFLQRFQHIFVKALARANNRGRQHDAFAGKCLQNRVRDLRGAHGRDFAAAYFSVFVAMPTCGRAATRPQQAHGVVDFRGGRNRAARRVAATALLNGDRWRQAINAFHIWLLHLVQKLPRVGRQTLHVLALALRENSVEGQTTFATARDTREDHQLIARNGKRKRF